MKAAKAGGWLPHEIAFALFLGITALRLFLAGGGGFFWGLAFAGQTALVFGLKHWATADPTRWRQQLRILAYVPLMLISYKASGLAVPVLHPGAVAFLAQADQWLLGNDAAQFLEKWTTPHLTDLFYGLYLSFFAYIAIGLWHYGRGDLATFRRFGTGLFTVYGLGFLGYTLVPAGGPYLELPDHFTTALTGSWITQIATTLVMQGTNRVDCFPCLHFGITFYILIFDFWHCRRRFYWMTLPCVGIWISTIYLRQHYLVDLFAGLALVLAVLWLVRGGPTAKIPPEPAKA